MTSTLQKMNMGARLGLVGLLFLSLSSAALARPGQLVRLSRDAQYQADDLYRQARYEARPNRPEERRALAALNTMQRTADMHYRAVLRNPRDSFRIFRGLIQDYRAASDAVYRARFSYQVDRMMREFDRTLRLIEFEYRH